ncbi:MAG: hypothetical protein JWP35_2934 [Caulobacter sp.]|nr:hypothetical protein [Caulobacter sp.]
MSIELAAPDARHPLHTLVSWPAVLAGVAVAIAAGTMLNLLGVALGAAAVDPFDLTRGEAGGFSVLGGVWVAIANAIALFAGGFVASRAAKYADHHRGILHGLTVWAVGFVVAIAIAGSTALGGVTSVLGGPSDSAAPAPAEIAATAVDNAASQAATPPAARDNLAVAPAAQPAVNHAVDATGTVALWAFLTMLLGAVGAIAGGRYGTRRHPWETKAHLASEHQAAEERHAKPVFSGRPI